LSKADGEVDDAPDDIHPFNTAALCDIPLLDGRSSGICSRPPFPAKCLFWPSGQRPRIAGSQARRGRLRRTGKRVGRTSPTRRPMT
ncbi:hypothetical protein T06_7200, partial [Trichinella sp. T6]